MRVADRFAHRLDGALRARRYDIRVHLRVSQLVAPKQGDELGLYVPRHMCTPASTALRVAGRRSCSRTESAPRIPTSSAFSSSSCQGHTKQDHEPLPKDSGHGLQTRHGRNPRFRASAADAKASRFRLLILSAHSHPGRW